MPRRKANGVRVGQIWKGVMGNCMVVVAIDEAGMATLRPLAEPEWTVETAQVAEFLTLEVDP